jgi:predicted GNAT family N-acyltransferase
MAEFPALRKDYEVITIGTAAATRKQYAKWQLDTSMQLETLDLRKLSEADARSVAELLCATWPKLGRTVEARVAEMTTCWRNYDGPEAQYPRSFLVRENGRVVAHASAVPRTIGASDDDLTVLALARVCTDPEVRGRKLGQAMVRAAFELVDRGTYAFALFQTSEAVRAFYERLSAVQVDNRFYDSQGEDPEASPFWDKVIMRYPATAGWPDGEIDTRGPGW